MRTPLEIHLFTRAAFLSTELVEHDVPQEEATPVREEPHPSSKPIPPSGPHSIPEAEGEGPVAEPESDLDRGSTSPSSYGAFTGFFTGLAVAVSNSARVLS